MVSRIYIENDDAAGRNADIGGGPRSPPAPDQLLIEAGAVHALGSEAGIRVFAGAAAAFLAARADEPADARLDRPQRQHGQPNAGVAERGLQDAHGSTSKRDGVLRELVGRSALVRFLRRLLRRERERHELSVLALLDPGGQPVAGAVDGGLAFVIRMFFSLLFLVAEQDAAVVV